MSPQDNAHSGNVSLAPLIARQQHGRAKKTRHQKMVGGKVFALDYGRLMGGPFNSRERKGTTRFSHLGATQTSIVLIIIGASSGGQRQ